MAKYVNKELEAWEAVKKQFHKGAKVKLNVGGPVMAVKDHVESSFEVGLGNRDWQVQCQWFSGKKLETGLFASETLVLVKDDAEEEQTS